MKVYNRTSIRVLTHNIRYATSTPFKGEELWEVRRPKLVNELHFATLHCAESFICLQEVLHKQLIDIICDLNKQKTTWACVGVGRDDGHEAGEYSPIIYRPTVWALKMEQTKWLSKTPDEPSKSWDAASIRILTIAVFQHKVTRKTVVAMNTHLDDQGSHSRLEAARIILEQIERLKKQGVDGESLPVFLAGDFNSEPDQEAYQEITKSISSLSDLRLLTPAEKRYGDTNTFTGFNPKTTKRKRIDFIFINYKTVASKAAYSTNAAGSEQLWEVEGYAILPNMFEDGVYNSDHQAVIGDLNLL